MSLEIINRIEGSSLTTIDLEDFYIQGERVLYDLKENLFMEAILKEKEFRSFVKDHDWSFYREKHVAVTCSVDAIIPAWAYMIMASKLYANSKTFYFGTLEQLELFLFQRSFATVDWVKFSGAKIVIKGCSDKVIPPSVYLEITKNLLPHVSSIMYGEPCSTVPVYKRK